MMTHEENATPHRDVRLALLRGWKRNCPNCGQGKVYDGYLTVNHSCSHCGQELHHHRADDGPAYITILVSAHIFGPLMLLVFELYRPSSAVLIISFCAMFIAFALYFLPRVKGALIALQWAKHMHGFGKA